MIPAELAHIFALRLLPWCLRLPEGEPLFPGPAWAWLRCVPWALWPVALPWVLVTGLWDYWRTGP